MPGSAPWFSDFAPGPLTGAVAVSAACLAAENFQTQHWAAVRGLWASGATEGAAGGKTQRAVNRRCRSGRRNPRPAGGRWWPGWNEAIMGGMAGGAGWRSVPRCTSPKPVVRTVTGTSGSISGNNQLDQRQPSAAPPLSVRSIPCSPVNRTPGRDQSFDPVRDIPAYQRQGFVRG